MGKTEMEETNKILDEIDEIYSGKYKDNEEFVSCKICNLLEIAENIGEDSLSRTLHYLEEAYGFYI